MKRIIINFSEKMNEITAVAAVLEIIKKGRISGDCFCFAATMTETQSSDDIVVFSDRTKSGTDTFNVVYEKEMRHDE